MGLREDISVAPSSLREELLTSPQADLGKIAEWSAWQGLTGTNPPDYIKEGQAQHPFVTAGSKIAGGVVPYFAPGGLIAKFTVIPAIQEVIRQSTTSGEDLNLPQRTGKVALAAATGNITGRVFRAADALKPLAASTAKSIRQWSPEISDQLLKVFKAPTTSVLQRVGITAGAAGVLSGTEQLGQQAISGEDLDFSAAVRSAAVNAAVIGSVRAMVEIPQLRGAIINKASELKGSQVTDLIEAKALLRNAQINPEELAPVYTQEMYLRNREAAIKKVNELSTVKKTGWETALGKEKALELIKEQNIKARLDLIDKQIYARRVYKDPKSISDTKALISFREIIANGADPVDIIIMHDMVKQMMPNTRIVTVADHIKAINSMKNGATPSEVGLPETIRNVSKYEGVDKGYTVTQDKLPAVDPKTWKAKWLKLADINVTYTDKDGKEQQIPFLDLSKGFQDKIVRSELPADPQSMTKFVSDKLKEDMDSNVVYFEGGGDPESKDTRVFYHKLLKSPQNQAYAATLQEFARMVVSAEYYTKENIHKEMKFEGDESVDVGKARETLIRELGTTKPIIETGEDYFPAGVNQPYEEPGKEEIVLGPLANEVDELTGLTRKEFNQIAKNKGHPVLSEEQKSKINSMIQQKVPVSEIKQVIHREADIEAAKARFLKRGGQITSPPGTVLAPELGKGKYAAQESKRTILPRGGISLAGGKVSITPPARGIPLSKFKLKEVRRLVGLCLNPDSLESQIMRQTVVNTVDESPSRGLRLLTQDKILPVANVSKDRKTVTIYTQLVDALYDAYVADKMTPRDPEYKDIIVPRGLSKTEFHEFIKAHELVHVATGIDGGIADEVLANIVALHKIGRSDLASQIEMTLKEDMVIPENPLYNEKTGKPNLPDSFTYADINELMNFVYDHFTKGEPWFIDKSTKQNKAIIMKNASGEFTPEGRKLLFSRVMMMIDRSNELINSYQLRKVMAEYYKDKYGAKKGKQFFGRKTLSTPKMLLSDSKGREYVFQETTQDTYGKDPVDVAYNIVSYRGDMNRLAQERQRHYNQFLIKPWTTGKMEKNEFIEIVPADLQYILRPLGMERDYVDLTNELRTWVEKNPTFPLNNVLVKFADELVNIQNNYIGYRDARVKEIMPAQILVDLRRIDAVILQLKHRYPDFNNWIQEPGIYEGLLFEGFPNEEELRQYLMNLKASSAQVAMDWVLKELDAPYIEAWDNIQRIVAASRTDAYDFVVDEGKITAVTARDSANWKEEKIHSLELQDEELQRALRTEVAIIESVDEPEAPITDEDLPVVETAAGIPEQDVLDKIKGLKTFVPTTGHYVKDKEGNDVWQEGRGIVPKGMRHKELHPNKVKLIMERLMKNCDDYQETMLDFDDFFPFGILLQKKNSAPTQEAWDAGKEYQKRLNIFKMGVVQKSMRNLDIMHYAGNQNIMAKSLIHKAVREFVNTSYPDWVLDKKVALTNAWLHIMIPASQEVGVGHFTKEGQYYTTLIGLGILPEEDSPGAFAAVQKELYDEMAAIFPDETKWKTPGVKRTGLDRFNLLPVELQRLLLWGKQNLELPTLDTMTAMGLMENVDIYQHRINGWTHFGWIPMDDSLVGYRTAISGTQISQQKYKSWDEFYIETKHKGMKNPAGKQLAPILDYAWNLGEYIGDSLKRIAQKSFLDELRSIRGVDELPAVFYQASLSRKAVTTDLDIMRELGISNTAPNKDKIIALYKSHTRTKAVTKKSKVKGSPTVTVNINELDVEDLFTDLGYIPMHDAPGLAEWALGSFRDPWVHKDVRNILSDIFLPTSSQKTNAWLRGTGAMTRIILSSPWQIYMDNAFSATLWTKQGKIMGFWSRATWDIIKGWLPWIALPNWVKTGKELKSGKKTTFSYMEEGIKAGHYDEKILDLMMEHGVVGIVPINVMEEIYDQAIKDPSLMTSKELNDEWIKSKFGLDHYTLDKLLTYSTYRMFKGIFEGMQKSSPYLGDDECARLTAKIVGETSYMLSRKVYGTQRNIIKGALLGADVLFGQMRIATGAAYPLWKGLHKYREAEHLLQKDPVTLQSRDALPTQLVNRAKGMANIILHGDTPPGDMDKLVKFYRKHLIMIVVNDLLMIGLIQLGLMALGTLLGADKDEEFDMKKYFTMFNDFEHLSDIRTPFKDEVGRSIYLGLNAFREVEDLNQLFSKQAGVGGILQFFMKHARIGFRQVGELAANQSQGKPILYPGSTPLEKAGDFAKYVTANITPPYLRYNERLGEPTTQMALKLFGVRPKGVSNVYFSNIFSRKEMETFRDQQNEVIYKEAKIQQKLWTLPKSKLEKMVGTEITFEQYMNEIARRSGYSMQPLKTMMEYETK